MYGKLQEWLEEKIPQSLQLPILIAVTVVALYFIYQTFSSQPSGAPLSPEAKQRFDQMIEKMRKGQPSANPNAKSNVKSVQ